MTTTNPNVIPDKNYTHNHLVRKQTLNHALVLSKEFLNIQATIECGFNLKCICDMIRAYSTH